jgi:four helix bundle protein
MQSPEKLQVAARARALALVVYRATAALPACERYGLSAQMRRASISIGSNIHEGCGRSGRRELLYFLHIALGSVSELEFQAIVATDLELFSPGVAAELHEAVNHTKRMLPRLITALRKRP